MSLKERSALSVLVVDDDEVVARSFQAILQSAGIACVHTCCDPRQAMGRIDREPPGAVLLDLNMPHLSGQALLGHIVREHPHVPTLIVTGADDVETAVTCMRQGAFDYLVKPVQAERLRTSVARALEMRELRMDYQTLKDRLLSDGLERPEAFQAIVTRNSRMRSLFRYIETIAPTARPVLITGESGVGKELVARAIHDLSNRPGLFVAVNAAGLEDFQFSDTLFGHLRGAFTGAGALRAGLIERAAGGTLFLDEIGDLRPDSQVKLLRLLQEGEYLPLGQDLPRQSNARILTATNQDPEALRAGGAFRMDLLYRLQTHHVALPPLRERRDDIPLLLEHFLDASARALGKPRPTPPRELVHLLGAYDFPGNVRELEAMVFDAVSHHQSRILSMERFHCAMDRNGPAPPRPTADGNDPTPRNDDNPFSRCNALPTMQEVPALLLREALRRAGGVHGVAARLLGLSRSGLSKALKRHNID